MAVPCFVAMAAAVSAFSCLGQASAFVSSSGAAYHEVGAALPCSSCSWKSSGLTAGLSSCSRPHIGSSSSGSTSRSSSFDASAHRYEYCRRRGGGGIRIALTQLHAHSNNKVPLVDEEEEDAQTTAGGRSVVPAMSDDADGGGAEVSLLEELLARGAEATKSGGATESSHTGSSEWAGFKTAPDLLEVRNCSWTAVEVQQCVEVPGRFCCIQKDSGYVQQQRKQVHRAPRPVSICVHVPPRGGRCRFTFKLVSIRFYNSICVGCTAPCRIFCLKWATAAHIIYTLSLE